jgi:hypothetical protein
MMSGVRWQAAIAGVVAACVLAPVLHATAPGSVLDQSDRSSTEDFREGATSYHSVYQAQTFTAGATGLLTDVVLPITSYYSPFSYDRPLPAGPPTASGSFVVEIFPASSGPPDPVTLAVSADIAVPPITLLGSRVDVDASFAAPVGIVKGHRYAIVLHPPAGVCWKVTSDVRWALGSCDNAPAAELLLSWSGQDGDPYPDGASWYLVGDPFAAGATWTKHSSQLDSSPVDLGFQTYVGPPDTSPPAAPPKLDGTLAGSTLDLGWTAANDDVAVDHYLVYRGLTQITQSTLTRATVSNIPTNTTSAFSVRAVDTSGNVGAPSPTVSVAPTRRPAGVPRVAPAWAYRLLAWQTSGSQSGRPKTPSPLPSWYAAWRQWRLHPLRIVGR